MATFSDRLTKGEDDGSKDPVYVDSEDNLYSLQNDEITGGVKWVTLSVSGGLPQAGGGTFTTSSSGASATGFTATGGTIQAGNSAVNGYGSLAGGFVGGSGHIQTLNDGAFAFGCVRNAGGKIEAQARGVTAMGYTTHAGYINPSQVGSTSFGYAGTNGASGAKAAIQTGGAGGFSAGYAYCSTASTYSWVSANRGALAHGSATNGGVVNASGTGTFAGGVSAGAGSYVQATSNGAFAHGWSSGGGYVNAQGSGATALGMAYGAGAKVEATGNGSGAFGNAQAGEHVSASAVNAFQFGVGSNTQASSLQVGGTIRLKGTIGAPTTPQNGDLWVNNNYVYIRTNGTSKKIV